MSNKTVLCVMFGGNSTEYEVSLKSSYSVLENVDREKYDIVRVGITREGVMYLYCGDDAKIKDNTWKDDTANLKKALMSTSYGDHAVYAVSDNGLERVAIDVVFPVMHGAYSEDGRLQGMLDMCGVPYVGPGCASSAVCMDKAFTKILLNNYGIPVAACVYVNQKDYDTDLDEIKNNVKELLGYPVFVKPANSGSSVGVSKVADESELEEALAKALKFDGKVLIEEAVVGREVEVAVLGNGDAVALTCGEIISDADFYDYDDKYNNGTSTYQIPAKLKKATWLNLKRMAEAIFEYLDCKGLSRVDFFVCGEDEKIIFNEINTLPGFTSISLYPKMAIESGYTYSGIVDRLVDLALEERKGK